MASHPGGPLTEGLHPRSQSEMHNDLRMRDRANDFGDPIRRKRNWGYSSIRDTGWLHNMNGDQIIKHYLCKFMDVETQTYVTIGFWTYTTRCSNGQCQGRPVPAARVIIKACNEGGQAPEEFESKLFVGGSKFVNAPAPVQRNGVEDVYERANHMPRTNAGMVLLKK